jgi:hypothetical protein
MDVDDTPEGAKALNVVDEPVTGWTVYETPAGAKAFPVFDRFDVNIG